MIILTPEEAVVQAAIAWHKARYPDLDLDAAFYTSDRLHEAVARLPVPVVYRCTVCGDRDDGHRFDACAGGEWVLDAGSQG